MLRQYDPPRFRRETISNRACNVGTMPVGTICTPHRAGCKVMIEAWLPRHIGAWKRDALGRHVGTYCARGGHIAMVRRLDNGRRFPLSDAWLLDTAEH